MDIILYIIYEHPCESKIHTKAFIEAVSRQVMKFWNRNEQIKSSKVKISGKLPGSCRTIQNTLNEVKLSFISSKQKNIMNK